MKFRKANRDKRDKKRLRPPNKQNNKNKNLPNKNPLKHNNKKLLMAKKAKNLKLSLFILKL